MGQSGVSVKRRPAMIIVRPEVVRPVLQRGMASVRQVSLAAARGVRTVLEQLGEFGPAATAVSMMLAAGLGVLALRTISFSEDVQPVLQSPPPAVAERAVRATASRPADQPVWRSPAPARPRAYLLASTPEQAERLRAAMSEANILRDAARLEPLEYEVYLVTNPEDERAIRQVVIEHNLNSEASGTTPILIIDMRKPAEPCEPDGDGNC
jgi:hypothetical protein